MTEGELGYAAGIFDGEGSVGIMVVKNGKGYVYHRLQLTITNTNPEVIQWLFERWGGCIHNPRYFAKQEWRAAHRWTLADGRAMKFLKEILPFLVIKKEQATLGIQFQETKRRGGFGAPKPDLALRESIRKQISNLNQGHAEEEA